MSGAQKGTGRNTKGAKHLLLISRAVTQDCETKMTILCTTWIDYKKACDSTPYTWILEQLEPYKINRSLRAFIRNSMWTWKKTLEANFKPIVQVAIKCGIYQEDTLSHCCSAHF